MGFVVMSINELVKSGMEFQVSLVIILSLPKKADVVSQPVSYMEYR